MRSLSTLLLALVLVVASSPAWSAAPDYPDYVRPSFDRRALVLPAALVDWSNDEERDDEDASDLADDDYGAWAPYAYAYGLSVWPYWSSYPWWDPWYTSSFYGWNSYYGPWWGSSWYYDSYWYQPWPRWCYDSRWYGSYNWYGWNHGYCDRHHRHDSCRDRRHDRRGDGRHDGRRYGRNDRDASSRHRLDGTRDTRRPTARLESTRPPVKRRLPPVDGSVTRRSDRRLVEVPSRALRGDRLAPPSRPSSRTRPPQDYRPEPHSSYRPSSPRSYQPSTPSGVRPPSSARPPSSVRPPSSSRPPSSGRPSSSAPRSAPRSSPPPSAPSSSRPTR